MGSFLISAAFFVGYMIVGLFVSAVVDSIIDGFDDNGGIMPFVLVVLFWPIVLICGLLMLVLVPLYPIFQRIARNFTSAIKEKLDKIEKEDD